MANQQTLEGNWSEIKGKLRRKWGQLTDNDLPQVEGSMDEVVGIIQRKTGEGREAIESYLREVAGSASAATSAVPEKARQYAQKAAQSVEQVRRQATDQVRAGYTQAQRLVRDQPGISLGVCFGAGLLTGFLLAISMRGR